jgi:GT2 family glycosyltransferase
MMSNVRTVAMGDASALNEALADAHEEILLLVAPGVELHRGARDAFEEVFEKRSCVVLAYSDFEDENGRVRLMEYNGDLTERFDFGKVIALRRSAALRTGGFDERLNHAHLYDLRLRLLEADGEALRVDRVLYSYKTPHTQGAPEGLLSDSFDYLFYDPEAEKEYERVFKDMLKRRGCFLDGQNEVVRDELSYQLPVSVVIPVLNRVSFIGQAVDSVLRGSCADFELIVSDTGSSDGTQDIVRSFSKKDSRVRLLQISQGNIAFALNAALQEARGKYVAQLDSDDEYLQDTLKDMVKALESNPRCGLAISYYEVMDEKGNPIPGVPPIKHLEYDRNNILRVGGAGAVRVFRTFVLRELGGFDVQTFGSFGEDYDMVLRISERYDIDRVHRILYRYRRHRDSTDTRRDPTEKLELKTEARRRAMERRRTLNLQRTQGS